jgi:hypothetical protein
MQTPRSTTELRNRPTSYEVAAFFPNGTRVRLGFTAQVNKLALIEIARQNADFLLDNMTEADASAEWEYSRANGLSFGNVRVALTGATEYQRAQEG